LQCMALLYIMNVIRSLQCILEGKEKMKKKYIPCILFLAIAVVGILVAGRILFPTVDESITIEGLQKAVTETESILIKSGDAYFAMQGTEDFSAVFSFDQWEKENAVPTGEAVLIFRFAESWILELYPGGAASAHNGYASKGKKQDAAYRIPDSVSKDLTAYISSHGMPIEAEEGIIGAGTFQK
jgi:hypothetical protein